MLDEAGRQRLDRTLNARSIAVVGASDVPGRVGYNILESLLTAGYDGAVYPVNPRLRSVLGLAAWPSVRELPEAVDLAVIAVNHYATVEVVAECAAQGVQGVVCVAGGFRELGPEGEKLEEDLVRAAQKHSLVLIGPNTLGFINPWAKINVTFYPMKLKPGSVALVSQSGGIGLSLVYRAFDQGLGLAKWIGCGNRSTLQFSDYLSYLAEDETTRVIGLFLEGVEDAAQVARLASTLVRKKPVVAYKAGLSNAIDYAAVTHTGSLAGSYPVYRDVFEQAGIILVDSVEELISACKALALCPVPPEEGVGILTHTAGPSIVALDELTRRGFSVPAWKEETVRALKEALPENPLAVVKNPLDVPGVGFDCVTYGRLADCLLQDAGIGSLLAVFTHNRCWRFPDAELVDLARRHAKAIVAVYVSPQDAVKEARELLQAQGIPVYTDAREAAVGLAALHRYRRVRGMGEEEPEKPELPDLRSFWSKAIVEGRTILTEAETKAILAACGIAVPDSREVESEEQAVEAAARIGFPVVLKVLSPHIIHKSEVGGVRLNLADSDAVRRAYREIMEGAAKSDPYARVTVQKMAPAGLEMIVGLAPDPHFGRVIMVGLGGVLVELLEDVVFCLPPLSRGQALAAMERLKGRQLLYGYRGREPVDREALAELVWRISYLAVAYPEIAEMDLNPVVVYPRGLMVLDARLRLALRSEPARDTAGNP